MTDNRTVRLHDLKRLSLQSIFTCSDLRMMFSVVLFSAWEGSFSTPPSHADLVLQLPDDLFLSSRVFLILNILPILFKDLE